MMTARFRAALVLLAAILCALGSPARSAQPLAGIWADNGGLAIVVSGRPFSATFKLLDANGATQDLTGRAFILSFRAKPSATPVTAPVLATASGSSVTLAFPSSATAAIATALRSQAGQMELDDATDGTPVRVLALPVVVYLSSDLIGTGPPSADLPTSTVTISANQALTLVQQTGARGLSSIDAGEPKSIISYGGYVGLPDNAAAFAAADAAAVPTYVPPGNYTTSAIPSGKYYGPGTVTVAGEVFPLTSVPTNILAPSTTLGGRLFSLCLGQGACGGINVGVTGGGGANVVIGPYALANGITSQRVTAVGWGCARYSETTAIVDCFGASALQNSTFANRVRADGANTGKWSGSSDPVGTGHDFFRADWGQQSVREGFWGAACSLDGGWRSVVGPISGPSLVVAANDNDNYENEFEDRDTAIHWVKGKHNTISGVHAEEGWLGDENTVRGWLALGIGTVTNYETVDGAGTFQHKMRGTNETATGAEIAPNLVHGFDNDFYGAQIGAVLDGIPAGTPLATSCDSALIDQNVQKNAIFGKGSISLAHVLTRNALFGIGNADAATALDSNAGIGYDLLDGVGTSTLWAGVGYQAGKNNAAALSNVFNFGPNTGRLKLSNTGTIGSSITDVRVSGRLTSTRNIAMKSSTTPSTYQTGNMIESIIVRTGPTAAFSDVTPAAAELVAAIPDAEVNTTFNLWISNNTIVPMGLIGGGGITMKRTTTVQPGVLRHYVARLDNVTPGSEAISIYGMETDADLSSVPQLVPANDNAVDAGSAAKRFRTVYASGLTLTGLPTADNDNVAATAGLTAGQIYRTSGGALMVKN